MARHRMGITKFKVGIQHADTLIATMGGAKIPTDFRVLETETGARTITGAQQTTKAGATTGEEVNIGDIVKYINLFIQCGPRATESSDEKGGWLEWAFLMVKETETVVPTTQTGLLTLGTICTNMYRNECIYTGAFPVGTTQTNMQAITIKVPRFKQRIRIGDEWRLITYFRPTISTAVELDAVKTIMSFIYKSYS